MVKESFKIYFKLEAIYFLIFGLAIILPCTSELLAATRVCSQLFKGPALLEQEIDPEFLNEEARICLKNVPSRYKKIPNFHELIFDPDRGLISRQTVREALAAINLVENFLFKGPIYRAPQGSFADFYTGDGTPIDIKLPSSPRTKNGKPVDPKMIEEWIRAKFARNSKNLFSGLAATIVIVLDVTYLTKKDLSRVRKHLQSVFSKSELEDIIEVKLPEPISYLRVKNSSRKK